MAILMRAIRRALLSGAAVVPLFHIGIAAAADDTTASDSAPALEEIVVSATKRNENLRDVPISISAVTQATMAQSGVKNIADLNSIVPGLNLLSVNVGGGVNYQMRGIASQVGAGTVAVYIDDTPIQNRNSKFSTTANPALFDLDRIEVLRGPQGTLFGSSSEGGTIRFITPQPSLDTWSGHARAEYGQTEHGSASQEIGVALGGPLVQDTVGLRISAFTRHEPGWIDQVSRSTGAVLERDTNTGETDALRAALKIKASDQLTIAPSMYYSRATLDDWASYYQYLGPFNNAETIHQPATDEFMLPSVTVNYNLPAVNVTSVTSFFKRNYSRIDDFSGIIADFYSIAGRNPNFLIPGGEGFQSLEAPGIEIVKQSNWTQELRASSADANARLLWTLGLYYSHADLITGQFVSASTPINPTNTGRFALLPGNYAGIQNSDLLEQQLAAFGDATYRVTDALKVTAGVRVQRVKIDTVSTGSGFFNGGNTTVGPNSVTENPVTPKVSVAYELPNANMFYASAAKGFRPGGANGNSIFNTNCAADIAISGQPAAAYNSDSVWSYEAGTKNRSFDNRLSINGSVFFIDWKDIQQSVTLPGCGANYTTNLGRATSKGGELELEAAVTEGFTLGANAAYTDATLADTVLGNPNPKTGAPGAVLGAEGDRVILTPKWTAAANARYEFTVTSGVKSYIRGEYKYFGDYTRTPGPSSSLYNAQLYYGEAYKLASLRAGVEWDNFDISAFANNLFDTNPVTYKVSASFLSRFIVLNSTPVPRTVGITASYKW